TGPARRLDAVREPVDARRRLVLASTVSTPVAEHLRRTALGEHRLFAALFGSGRRLGGAGALEQVGQAEAGADDGPAAGCVQDPVVAGGDDGGGREERVEEAQGLHPEL